MRLDLKRTPGIYLTGFMCSGKSTVGRLLAARIGWNFADIDADIEGQQQTSIVEIFDKRGEEEFRRLETETIRRTVRTIECGRPTVVALGGGAFTRPENVELVGNNGVSIWLDAPFELVKRRVAPDRPLARNAAHFEALYYERRPLYSRAAHRVEVSGDDPAVVLESILALRLLQ